MSRGFRGRREDRARPARKSVVRTACRRRVLAVRPRTPLNNLAGWMLRAALGVVVSFAPGRSRRRPSGVDMGNRARPRYRRRGRSPRRACAAARGVDGERGCREDNKTGRARPGARAVEVGRDREAAADTAAKARRVAVRRDAWRPRRGHHGRPACAAAGSSRAAGLTREE